jgi:hypothetical protein
MVRAISNATPVVQSTRTSAVKPTESKPRYDTSRDPAQGGTTVSTDDDDDSDNGLVTVHLSREIQEVCEKVHSEFLRKHRLKYWILSVVGPTAPARSVGYEQYARRHGCYGGTHADT